MKIVKSTNKDWEAFLDFINANQFQSYVFIGVEGPLSEYSLTAGGAWKSKSNQVGALEIIKHSILHNED